MRRILSGALCVMLFCILVLSFRAEAQENAVGLVCDTAEQVILYASLAEEKGVEGAVQAVNEDAKDPTACVVASIHYIRGDEKAKVTIEGRQYTVSEILVLGVQTGRGWMPIKPSVYYSLFEAEGQPA